MDWFSLQLQAEHRAIQRQLVSRCLPSLCIRNQVSKFNRLLKQLDAYPGSSPISNTIRFDAMSGRLKPQQVDLFLQRYADYPFAYHARGRWLDMYWRDAATGKDYLEFFDDRANTRLQCHIVSGTPQARPVRGSE